MRANSDWAKEIAVKAIIWLADQPDRLGAFLGATGAQAGDLRTAVQDPVFLASVLDFLLMSDEGVVAFAQDSDLAPEDVLRARADLPGGDLPNWT
ncbi:MAG: DUF3572 domain-containing protein [Pseudomonadota bacterium]